MGSAALRRWLGAATITGALLLAAAPDLVTATAEASTTQPSTTATINPYLNGIAVSPGGDLPNGSGSINLNVTGAPGITQLANLTVTLGTSKLPAGATLTMSSPFQWQCTTSTGSVVCAATGQVPVSYDLRSNFYYVSTNLFFDVTAAADAGYALGSLTVSATADGLTGGSTSVQVAIAEPVQLTTGPFTSFTGPPGSTYSPQWTVTNAGSTTVHGVGLYIEGDPGFDLTKQYSNCRYPQPSVAFCTFDNDLAPGVTYEVSEPTTVRIAANHVAPFLGATVIGWYTRFDLSADLVVSGAPGTGGPLGLVVESTQAAAPPLTQPGLPQTVPDFVGGTHVDVTVSGVNPADLVAVGASVPVSTWGGSVGLAVGVTNQGPAAASMSRSGDPLTGVTVTLPTGTTAAAAPLDCAPYVSGQPDFQQLGKPGYGKYDCLVYQNLAVQQNYPLSFTVQVPAGTTPLVGSVTITDDANPAGNTAPIAITPQVPGRQVGPPGPPMPRR
jgi:hypothetical protein